VIVARVVALRTSALKGLIQNDVDVIELDADGIVDDRRFAVLNPAGWILYGGDFAQLGSATAQHDVRTNVLSVRFDDGETVEAAAGPDEAVVGRAYGDVPVPGHVVAAPIAEALSRRLGVRVRVMRTERSGTTLPGPLTILGRQSVRRLGDELGVRDLDVRRFKMNIEIDGLNAHGEDAWCGREVQVGEAIVQVGGQVPRCVLTTRDPATGRRDHDVLRAILRYRAPMDGGKAPFGVYASVVRRGRVRVGDPVTAV